MANPFGVYDDAPPPNPAAAQPPQGGTANPFGVYDAPASAPASGDTSWWDTAKGAAQTVDDAVRAAANAMTFGMADRAAGYLSGTGTDAEVKRSEEARARSPYASVAGDVAGAVAVPAIGGEALAAQLGTRLAPSLGRAAPWVGRALGYGTEGAAIGAAQGAGNTYTGIPQDYVNNALLGGVLGFGTGGVLGGAFGPRPATPRLPTAGEARQATDMAYDALRANTTPYSASSLSRYADALETRLQSGAGGGYVRDYSPGTWAAIERMRSFDTGPGSTVLPHQIDSIRQGLNRIPKNDLAATDRSSGRVVKQALDDFLINPPVGAVPATSAAQQAAVDAAQLARTATASRAAQGRMEMLANIRQYAIDSAAAAHSGGNVDNTIRQQVKSRLLNPLSPAASSRFGAYNPAEQDAIRNVVHATGPENFMRRAAKMMGGGSGVAVPLVGATLGGTIGHYTSDNSALGGLVGVGGPALGMTLNALANASARGRIRNAERLVASRSPLAQTYAARGATTPGAAPLSGGNVSNLRDAITYEMLRQGALAP